MTVRLLSSFILLLTFFMFSAPVSKPRAAMTSSGEMIISPEYAEAEELIRKDDFKQAIVLLNKTLEQHPGHANAWNLLGYAHRRLGKFDDAEKFYDAALTITPNHTGALNYMGQMFLETGRPEKAKALLERLKKACEDGCEDLENLKKAMAAGVAGKY
jgi:Flp pilus assembly protein TadD